MRVATEEFISAMHSRYCLTCITGLGLGLNIIGLVIITTNWSQWRPKIRTSYSMDLALKCNA